MSNKDNTHEVKELTPAEIHDILLVDLLEMKMAETVEPEEVIEIQQWIRDAWEEMSAEEQVASVAKLSTLREKYGNIL